MIKLKLRMPSLVLNLLSNRNFVNNASLSLKFSIASLYHLRMSLFLLLNILKKLDRVEGLEILMSYAFSLALNSCDCPMYFDRTIRLFTKVFLVVCGIASKGLRS
jgi:hypothetical protein